MSDPNNIRDILAACYQDSQTMAKVFLPERFWRPFDPQVHGQMFDLIDNSDNPLKAIAAPRGMGKTSIINLLLPMKAILFQESRYIVPVSATTDLAMQQAENLKQELIINPLVEKLYGPLASQNFSKRQWVVNIGDQDICVMPRGAGQQIRGLLYRNYRPGLILVDDLEDPEAMDSEEQRAKKKEWFYADLLNCVDRGKGSQWQIIVLGTILHQDSLLEGLLDNPSWDSIRLELCDDNLNSLAPNFMSTKDVRTLYQQFKEAGKEDTFYREYRNNPVPISSDATFPSALFKNYDPVKENLDANPQIETMVIVDPAKTTNLKSAESAIVAISIDMQTNAIYIRDIVARKMHPHELYAEICEMIVRNRAFVLGVEVTSLHEFIVHPLKNELLRNGLNVEFIDLHARGGDNERGKIQRIKQLSHYYRGGLIFHNPAVCPVLEGQLMSFPRSKRWDVMDAVGYFPEMLERGERYMLPALTAGESRESVEKEYEELDKDGYYSEALDSFHVI